MILNHLLKFYVVAIKRQLFSRVRINWLLMESVGGLTLANRYMLDDIVFSKLKGPETVRIALLDIWRSKLVGIINNNNMRD